MKVRSLTNISPVGYQEIVPLVLSTYLFLALRIQANGFLGESSPSTNNGTRDGRGGKNRRVEIRVYSDVIATSAGTPVAQR